MPQPIENLKCQDALCIFENMDVIHLILYIVVCILLMGFFAGIEIAFISANKLNIELRKKQGKSSGRILARFMENPAEFIGTSLVGVNILLVIYGLLITQLTDPIFDRLPYPFNSEYASRPPIRSGTDS